MGADFPEDFFFGSSTSAHQVEGGNTNNDWWDWEHRPGVPAAASSGDAIDHYHRYEADFDLLAALGHNAHRLSLEWSRIEPAPGEWSQAALDHYKRVLTALAGRGMTGFVTLMHFTLPRWLAERGGWLAPDAVERFATYAGKVATELGDLIPYVGTINEPQIAAFYGYLTGQFPPGRSDFDDWGAAGAAQLAAHQAAVDVLRSGRGSPRSGICLQLPALEPARPGDAECEEAVALLREEMFTRYIGGLRADPKTAGDFVGVQYYTNVRIDPTVLDRPVPPPEGVWLSQVGWEWHPEGLRAALHAAASVGLPLVITENGIATADDAERVDYLEAHLRALRQAMDDGLDVRGYLYWSSFDTFEWNAGFRPTYGLVGVDRARGLARVVRPSAAAFAAMARSRSIAALRQ